MYMKTIRLSTGVILQYAEQGNHTGTPVIFLHGYTDSLRSYQLIFPLLPSNIHAYALSQRGHGDSERPRNDYAPKHFAADVSEFISKMGLSDAIIVGHSMGATIAQRIVIDYPEKVIGLVLIGSLASFADNTNVVELYDIISKFTDPIDRGFVEEFQRSTVAKPISDAFFRTVVGESMKVPARVWKAVLSGLMDVDYTTELKAVEKPVVLMWGDLDTFAVKKDQLRLLESIKESRLSVYGGASHSIHWEEPQRFVHELESFVKEVVEKPIEVA